MRTRLGDRILRLIKGHEGRENAIHSATIACALGLPEGWGREVRRTIADESAMWDVLVCSVAGPDGGFFVAVTYEEIERHHNWLLDLRDNAKTKQESFRHCAQRAGYTLQDTRPEQRRAA